MVTIDEIWELISVYGTTIEKMFLSNTLLKDLNLHFTLVDYV